MNREQLIDRINDLLVNEFEVDEDSIRPEADLYRDMKLDSLDGIDLITILEKEMGIRVDPQKLRGIRSLAQLYDFVIGLAESAGRLE